ncbi:hypothetical protein MLD38_009269 [Melastoma candidum]|uniref:Uncharacterized protein n=1 Tax=Melastoma candidum TaxID=119954 RepID=A0ACB9RW59_9MYRT|nr:hypothetical protein MLD38_009269 [Melastoma candidum]
MGRISAVIPLLWKRLRPRDSDGPGSGPGWSGRRGRGSEGGRVGDRRGRGFGDRGRGVDRSTPEAVEIGAGAEDAIFQQAKQQHGQHRGRRRPSEMIKVPPIGEVLRYGPGLCVGLNL